VFDEVQVSVLVAFGATLVGLATRVAVGTVPPPPAMLIVTESVTEAPPVPVQTMVIITGLEDVGKKNPSVF